MRSSLSIRALQRQKPVALTAVARTRPRHGGIEAPRIAPSDVRKTGNRDARRFTGQ
jgi:hypothetical protein